MEPTSNENSLIINIAESLSTSIEMLEPLSGDCCIYKVPPHLYCLNEEAYTPKVVSMGPYHHGKPELKSMESHKLRYLRAFLDNIKIRMEQYIEGIKELEIRLYESYVDIKDYNKEKFIKTMAVDGAFLMQFLLKIYFEKYEINDRIFGRQRLHVSVRDDLLLIENQLPFFYLNYLFSLYKKANEIGEEITLKKIMQKFLSEEATLWKGSMTNDIVTEENGVLHLLHLLIISLQQSRRNEVKECANLSTPTISDLHRAGVKFEPSSTYCLCSIKFDNGVLKIPFLRLTDNLEQVFRNIQAFGQCHFSANHITDYIWIMDMLVNNEDDVKVLIKNGIIENWMEDNNAAASVFNNLNTGNTIDPNDFSYAHVVEGLNEYYKIRRHKWKATLKQKYFNNPWAIISVIAAAILLLLTVVQTVCSILQVV